MSVETVTTIHIIQFAKAAAPIFALKEWKWAGGFNRPDYIPTAENIEHTATGLIYAAEDCLQEYPERLTVFTSMGRIMCVAHRDTPDGEVTYNLSLRLTD